MADTRQTQASSAKKRRQPWASYEELVEDREEMKKLVGQQMADADERTDRVLTASTAQTDALRALAEPLTQLVDVLSERQGGSAPPGADAGEGDTGSAGEAIPTAAGTDDGAAGDVEDEPQQTAENEPEATADDDAEIAADTAGGTAESDADPESGPEIAETDTTSAEADRAASDRVEEEEPKPSDTTEETPEGETELAGNAAPDATASPGSDEATTTASGNPSAEEAASVESAGTNENRSGTADTTTTDRREADEAEAEAGRVTAVLAEILAVLSAMREDMGDQAKLIQHIHRSPPAAASVSPDPAPGAGAERRHHELTGYLDKAVIALVELIGSRDQTSARDLPHRPPPSDIDKVAAAVSDLAKQLRTERRGFGPLAWIAAVAGVIALPATLAAGIFLQKEFDLVPVADPSMGWKDRIWEEMGPEIAGCLNLEDGGAGDCVVTVTSPTQ